MSRSRPSTADKRRTFRKLHEADCFVIPNPWSVGSARYLQGLGFKALATTSSGHAHSEGLPDGGQTIDDVLAHYAELAAATDVPLNADFENGFADAGRGRRERHALYRDRRGRAFGRGFAQQRDYSALRFRSCAQARQSCACRDRQGGR